MKDFYRILGVPDNAHEQDIKLAYRRLAKKFHPDLNPGDKKSEEKFKEIVEAYDTLSDPILKSAYDRKKSGRGFFDNYASFKTTDSKKDKRDPNKKEYSKEDFDRARDLHHKRELVKMARRKKILIGMIITFVLYLVGGGSFQYWIDQQRDKAEELSRQILAANNRNNQQQNNSLDVLDSPYDTLFGGSIYLAYCPNNLVIFNHFSKAIVCAVEADPPHRTIRNEYVTPSIDPIVLRNLPNGSYYIKIYAGSDWDFKKKIPDGRAMGGFRNSEKFFKMHAGPFKLVRTTHEHNENEHLTDTIWIDPKIMGMDSISRNDFFSAGDK